jgi:hypothetical protein
MLGAIVILSLVQAQETPINAKTTSVNGMRIDTKTSATAIRANPAPEIDGRDDDPVWRDAPLITEFVEFSPVEGKEPRFKTEAKVSYDSRYFYVFVRMFDPEPDKILKLLARRDVRPPSDQIKIIIDSYHDRRSGYEFAVNPAGVKRDYAVYNDWNEDGSWDGVWDASTTVDSLGWTAEFRIPLSQMRYPKADRHTFGFAIWRDIERFKERVSWPLYRSNQSGLMSQIGEISGIEGLRSPQRLELLPYAVTKNITVQKEQGFSHPQRLSGGLDFKYGLSSNLTVDGTVNPDFGQVEADPAVLNLSAFETFFQERRPFFMEGAGLLSFSMNCFAVNDCGRENLFYSRRIGRAPQLGFYGDATSATGTTILGAAKVTGRTPGGLAIGLLQAVTNREVGTEDRTIEPLSSYSVFRANQDLRKGETSIGVIGTLVARNQDEWSRDYLRSTALVSGVDFRHRFAKGRFEVRGRMVGSRVTGSEEAIAGTQTNSVHYLQRPDADLGFDPTRTSMSGHAGQLQFAKVGGGNIMFETSYQRVSPGFEANDLGFIRRADWQSWATWGTLRLNKPGPFYRRFFWNLNQWNDWTTEGLPLERATNTNVHFELPNSFWAHFGGTLGGLGKVYCDRCSRGGPAIRTDQFISPWAGIEGDSRWRVVPGIWMNYYRADGGRSHSLNLSPWLDFRVSSRLGASLGFNYSWTTDDRQWIGNPVDPDGTTHYTFAHLVQRTASLQSRINFTASPTLSFELYAEPFVSKGTYSNVRELADPRAEEYTDRFKQYGDGNPAAGAEGFNFKQFKSNAVIRWEYRPGSALFLVWQHGREDYESGFGGRSMVGDVRHLFNAPANNTFLVKLSYWLDR